MEQSENSEMKKKYYSTEIKRKQMITNLESLQNDFGEIQKMIENPDSDEIVEKYYSCFVKLDNTVHETLKEIDELISYRVQERTFELHKEIVIEQTTARYFEINSNPVEIIDNTINPDLSYRGTQWQLQNGADIWTMVNSPLNETPLYYRNGEEVSVVDVYSYLVTKR
jgi:hypothetical protein